jgi:hypothetical protein
MNEFGKKATPVTGHDDVSAVVSFSAPMEAGGNGTVGLGKGGRLD